MKIVTSHVFTDFHFNCKVHIHKNKFKLSKFKLQRFNCKIVVVMIYINRPYLQGSHWGSKRYKCMRKQNKQRAHVLLFYSKIFKENIGAHPRVLQDISYVLKNYKKSISSTFEKRNKMLEFFNKQLTKFVVFFGSGHNVNHACLLSFKLNCRRLTNWRGHKTRKKRYW